MKKFLVAESYSEFEERKNRYNDLHIYYDYNDLYILFNNKKNLL